MKLPTTSYILFISALFSLSFLSFSCAQLVPIIPYPFGTNIHFTTPLPGELDMLSGAGFKYVRMDLSWSEIEKAPGQYNFSAYDILVSNLDAHGLAAVFILDYSNPLYDGGLSPHTDAGRNAFAKWALAAVTRYQGKQYLWEMYNEPNGGFWTPVQNVTAYAELAIAVGKVLKPALPKELYMGPAISWFDFNWLTAVFELGVLEYFDLVSLHPYRGGQNPETATANWAQLSQLVAKYAPKGKEFLFISSEWGYSINYPGMDIVSQGKFLPRMLLTNVANQVALSIYYDWHDDGTNSSYSEDNFGTVYYQYYPNRNPCYDPKPNYISAYTLMHLLEGYMYVGNVNISSVDYVYEFLSDIKLTTAYVIWTTESTNHTVEFPAVPGTYQSWDYLGSKLGLIDVGNSGVSVIASDGPLYLIPQ